MFCCSVGKQRICRQARLAHASVSGGRVAGRPIRDNASLPGTTALQPSRMLGRPRQHTDSASPHMSQTSQYLQSLLRGCRGRWPYNIVGKQASQGRRAPTLRSCRQSRGWPARRRSVLLWLASGLCVVRCGRRYLELSLLQGGCHTGSHALRSMLRSRSS